VAASDLERPVFVIRDVQRSDLRDLARLAELLDTVNLPAQEKTLLESIDRSVRSFDGRIRDPFRREYLFVLEDPEKKRVIGTSLIIAQHGTRDAPHVFFDVYEKEHYSHNVDKHFKHRVLQIGYNFEGPTEIGGLVVHPDYRRHDKPGKQLSYVRFLFVAAHRPRFCERVLVELLPRLEDDGRSPLWEALGRKFTGLSYQEADRLSRQNKEFIQQLFPPGEIYATLFSQKIQDAIGVVGPESEGARSILERIGFQFDERIDPFDGGPHWSAPTGQIEPIRHFRRARVSADALPEDAAPVAGEVEDRLVSIERSTGRNRFRCVRTLCRFQDASLLLPKRARELLGARTGDRLGTIPFGS
jgi:arginine N-succinyltransferase